MNKPLFTLKNVSTTVQNSVGLHINILKNLNLTINEGDFITVLGSNGAGKSTLFNVIAGGIPATSGSIMLENRNITNESALKRTKYISRVFQDPKLGTAPRMTVAENLLLALNRNKSFSLMPRQLNKHIDTFTKLTKQMGNGLDQRLQTSVGSLSGGQRQALSFLMATIQKPKLLLLDEHTAALDPKTSAQLMKLTDEKVTANAQTALMITHNLEDALTYGNRLIVLHAGQITLDVTGVEKQKLTKEDLLNYFASY